MSDTALAFLRARNICVCCHQYHNNCPVQAPDAVGRHEDYYRIMTASRPWWTAEELMRIIERDEYRTGILTVGRRSKPG